jgi:hypothetical protein
MIPTKVFYLQIKLSDKLNPTFLIYASILHIKSKLNRIRRINCEVTNVIPGLMIPGILNG